jgi:hypothetical protein
VAFGASVAAAGPGRRVVAVDDFWGKSLADLRLEPSSVKDLQFMAFAATYGIKRSRDGPVSASMTMTRIP